jgi:UDP-glucose 4-epimerase
MSRCYVTGIAGFLGSHLADHLAAQGHEVWGCDDLSTGDAANLPLEANCRVGSIERIDPGWLAGTEIIYHTAAAAYEGVSSFSPAFISQNIYAGSAAVFSAAIAAGIKRIVFTSSMARYGERPWDTIPGCQEFEDMGPPEEYNEGMLPRPVDPYGIAKEAAERLLINLCETHGVEWSIAVPHNIYGPRQAIDPYRNVATIFANQMLLGRQPTIYGDGHQVRCFSYIDDVVSSLARMGFSDAAKGEIINIGPDQGEVSVLTLADMLADIIGIRFDPVFLPPRPREVSVATCSADKARRLLGFEQHTELKDGLVKLVEWLQVKGPREFRYHLPIEIESPLTPQTWIHR